jgi:hypothetical protein
VADYRSEMQRVVADQQLIVRIDRIEPSKNIVRGFRAFEEMLELHPEHRRHVKFLALLVPSRLEVAEYRSYLDELMAAAGRVNARYGDSGWEPVRLLIGDDYERAVAALQVYDAAQCHVDGMNLVAKKAWSTSARACFLSERAGRANNWSRERWSLRRVTCTQRPKRCIKPWSCRPKSVTRGRRDCIGCLNAKILPRAPAVDTLKHLTRTRMTRSTLPGGNIPRRQSPAASRVLAHVAVWQAG